jgi:hypothetical protein
MRWFRRKKKIPELHVGDVLYFTCYGRPFALKFRELSMYNNGPTTATFTSLDDSLPPMRINY